MPLDEPVAFRSSRAKTLIVSGGCTAMAAMITAAALIAPSIWPWLGVAYFGGLAALTFLNGFFRPATLRLDAQGLQFVHWRHRWSVAWVDVAEVRLMTLRINGFRSHDSVVLIDRFGAKHAISSGLTIAPATLAHLIRSRCLPASIAAPPVTG